MIGHKPAPFGSPQPPAQARRLNERLLAASGISKSFWRRGRLLQGRIENRALDDVSLDLAPGEILGLVGESGCGKSTFAKVLLGLETADRGRLTIDGTEVFSPNRRAMPAAQRGIQMVSRTHTDPQPAHDGARPFGEGLRIRATLSRAEIDTRFEII